MEGYQNEENPGSSPVMKKKRRGFGLGMLVGAGITLLVVVLVCAGLSVFRYIQLGKLSQIQQGTAESMVDMNMQRKLQTSAAESKAVSARGVWHRPTEVNYGQIEETVRTYAKIGINMVFVETWYGGYSSFRSSFADFPYNPQLSATYNKDADTVYQDYLSAFVACCQEYGIEVHAWVENFYVGLNPEVPIVANHPDWIMYNDDGTIYVNDDNEILVEDFAE